jgi:hypothetical protein
MSEWDVMRQGDNGDQALVSTYDSRVGALTRVLVMQSGVAHKQSYWVEGPAEPVLTTNRDLYLHLLRLGRRARGDSWSLSAFLRGLRHVGESVQDRGELTLDDVAAMFDAALTVAPPAYDPSWSSADLALPGGTPVDHADWDRVIRSQLADLEDLAARPTGGRGKVEVSRSGGPRATPRRWCNTEVAAYLECAVAGSLGGWDAADGARVALPGGPPASPVRAVTPLSWEGMARLAVCGQLYE